MSANPKDHRPKIISFNTTLNGLNIAARQSVLWPCHAFNISIPQKRKRSLNVFEETVLKVTEIESGDTDKIAQLTCLEKELVAFIQNRLNQLGLLDNRYELTEHGRGLLNEWQNKSDGNLEYTIATVFVDLLSGKLLPYVSTEQLSYKKISRVGDSGFIEFLINPTNEKSKVNARQIRPAKDSYWKAIPDSNDIIRAIREFKKKYKRHALLNQSVDQSPPTVPMAEAISVHDNPELVYLHCEALIQVGNSDLLVTDGCGFGFAESFVNYLTSQNLLWVTKLKKKGVVEGIDSGGNPVNGFANKPYKYTEISRRIKRSQNSLLKVNNLTPNSSNYEREYKREIEFGIKNLYAGLEWVLRQVVADYPVPEWENVFSGQNIRDNKVLLHGFGEKIGFLVTEKNQRILQVKAGAVRQIEKGKVEFQPLLALCIAGANANSAHPMHNLAQNHSTFLDTALKLKTYRDPIEHGSTEDLNLHADTLAGLLEETIPIVVSLVPGVACDLNLESSTSSERDIDQERLKATIELEKNFGTALVYDFSYDIKEQLLRSEMMLAKYTDDNAIEIIKCYASVIQQALCQATNDRRLESKRDGIREEAIEKIVQFGFCPYVKDIPKEISTVAERNVLSTVDGLSTTLGAHLLAVFLLGSESELKQLKESGPEFIEFIAVLTRLRGHGNKPPPDFFQSDMESLKNNVIKVIKIITEVF